LKIGVLALQGDFAAHATALRQAAWGNAIPVEVVEVRRTAELSGLDGLVLPGGESTTLLNLMQDEPWFDRLQEFHGSGGAILGTCAGAILLSREVLNPEQPSLGLIDATIERNGFGRQVDSFETELAVDIPGGRMAAVFIRAPRFRRLSGKVEVLGSWQGEPVLVREGRAIACTFHPELTGDVRLHAFFLSVVQGTDSEALKRAFDTRGAVASREERWR
jgi:5'-phosphate synthase pdxT subunit